MVMISRSSSSWSVYAHSTTRNGAELMTVGTLEHDALAVEQHPIVLQLELAETDFLPSHLYQMACIVQQLDFQVIQSRVLYTPQVGFSTAWLNRAEPPFSGIFRRTLPVHCGAGSDGPRPCPRQTSG